jgi:excisionase family DNA binding protein
MRVFSERSDAVIWLSYQNQTGTVALPPLGFVRSIDDQLSPPGHIKGMFMYLGAAVSGSDPDVPQDDPWLTAEQGARQAHVHVQTIRIACRNKTLRATKIGKAWRFRQSWLTEWIERDLNQAG